MNKLEQFLQDVRTEVELLKQHALSTEKENLNLETFSPESKQNCIYGQLTGYCQSIRAKELMDLCCKRVMHFKGNYIATYSPMENVVPFLNGNNKSQTWGEPVFDNYTRNYDYLSTLEAYILTAEAKNAEMISYIKGETDTLNL